MNEWMIYGTLYTKDIPEDQRKKTQRPEYAGCRKMREDEEIKRGVGYDVLEVAEKKQKQRERK
jgi:hypothetical protein